jgi:uridine phosphorylase
VSLKASPPHKRALRDEGTSYHYLPPTTFAEAPDATLLARIEAALRRLERIVTYRGATWTTDAPYRETETAIAVARAHGVLAVEMEAAALYAFAASRAVTVVTSTRFFLNMRREAADLAQRCHCASRPFRWRDNNSERLERGPIC